LTSFGDGQVVLEVLAHEPRAGLAPVVVTDSSGVRMVPVRKAVARRGIGDEADAQFAQCREHAVLGVAGPQ
jgi:hypothetical protein